MKCCLMHIRDLTNIRPNKPVLFPLDRAGSNLRFHFRQYLSAFAHGNVNNRLQTSGAKVFTLDGDHRCTLSNQHAISGLDLGHSSAKPAYHRGRQLFHFYQTIELTPCLI